MKTKFKLIKMKYSDIEKELDDFFSCGNKEFISIKSNFFNEPHKRFVKANESPYYNFLIVYREK